MNQILPTNPSLQLLIWTYEQSNWTHKSAAISFNFTCWYALTSILFLLGLTEHEQLVPLLSSTIILQKCCRSRFSASAGNWTPLLMLWLKWTEPQCTTLGHNSKFYLDPDSILLPKQQLLLNATTVVCRKSFPQYVFYEEKLGSVLRSCTALKLSI